MIPQSSTLAIPGTTTNHLHLTDNDQSLRVYLATSGSITSGSLP